MIALPPGPTYPSCKEGLLRQSACGAQTRLLLPVFGPRVPEHGAGLRDAPMHHARAVVELDRLTQLYPRCQADRHLQSQPVQRLLEAGCRRPGRDAAAPSLTAPARYLYDSEDPRSAYRAPACLQMTSDYAGGGSVRPISPCPMCNFAILWLRVLPADRSSIAPTASPSHLPLLLSEVPICSWYCPSSLSLQGHIPQPSLVSFAVDHDHLLHRR